MTLAVFLCVKSLGRVPGSATLPPAAGLAGMDSFVRAGGMVRACLGRGGPGLEA